MFFFVCLFFFVGGGGGGGEGGSRSPEAQWFQRWPADLVIPGSISAGGGNPLNR